MHNSRLLLSHFTVKLIWGNIQYKCLPSKPRTHHSPRPCESMPEDRGMNNNSSITVSLDQCIDHQLINQVQSINNTKGLLWTTESGSSFKTSIQQTDRSNTLHDALNSFLNYWTMFMSNCWYFRVFTSKTM